MLLSRKAFWIMKTLRLSLKYRIIEKPISKFFYWLSSRQSRLLRVGFIEKLRRKFAPTGNEIRQDIILKHGDNVNSCVRELINLDSVCRKISLPDDI